jgi:HSP20 family protein
LFRTAGFNEPPRPPVGFDKSNRDVSLMAGRRGLLACFARGLAIRHGEMRARETVTGISALRQTGEKTMPRALAPWGGVKVPKMFEDLHDEMNELMRRFFEFETNSLERLAPVGLEHFAPRYDLTETDKEYLIRFDLPGMKSEDFNIEIREGELRITGERKSVATEEGKGYRHLGCRYGRFEERIPLDLPVKADQVQAQYKDGVLAITVPKDKSVQPKRIEVKTA